MDPVFAFPQDFALAALVLVLAQCVYVLFGFGAGLITVGLMALFHPHLTDVVVVLCLVCLPSELLVVWRCRRAIVWRGITQLLLWMGIGVLLGTYGLKQGEPTVVLSVLAVFLLVAGAAFLAVPERGRIRWPRWFRSPIGLISGILAGLFGTGGPPLILYYQMAGTEKARFRGSLMAIFLSMTVVRLPAYVAGGLITPQRLGTALLLLPAALVGAYAGNRIQLRLSERTFRRWVSIALMVIGALLLVRLLRG